MNEEKIEWKVKFDSYEEKGTMPMDRAKIEAQRRIAEELNQIKLYLKEINISVKHPLVIKS